VNLFDEIDPRAATEQFDALLERPGLRIERIVSRLLHVRLPSGGSYASRQMRNADSLRPGWPDWGYFPRTLEKPNRSSPLEGSPWY